jgi:hypothetical protein
MKAIAKAALALGVLVAGTTLAQAQTYIGATVSGVLAPGVFGRVDIGNLGGMPPVISPQPVYVQPARGVAPVYVYAPPYERRNWRRYCGRYNACRAPVYFVDVSSNGRWARPVGHRPPPPRYVAAPPPRVIHRHDERRHWDRDDRRRWEERRHDRRWEGRHDDRRDRGHRHRRDRDDD